MRILLINPPDTRPRDFKTRVGICPPLSLAYVAAVLESVGHTVTIYDALVEGPQSWHPVDSVPVDLTQTRVRWGAYDWEILAQIYDTDPDIVGVTCPFPARQWDALNILRTVRTISLAITTWVGGAHPTCHTRPFLASPAVDYVALGSGEEFLSRIGLAPLPPKYHLDDLPFPARHLLPMTKYWESSSPHSGFKRTPFTNMITSRGCPNRCEFCVIGQIWPGPVRYRSPESVLAEIWQLVTDYGIREIQFEDDNFLSNRTRAETILIDLRDNFDLALASPSGLSVKTLDNALLDLMVSAGYYSISLAVESGSPQTLKSMKKPVNLAKVPGLVRHAQSLGLRVKAFFILGYPGETKDDVERTIQYAESLELDWAIFFPASAIPGSRMAVRCLQEGWLTDTDLTRLFYMPNIKTEEFDPEWVVAKTAEANERVNSKSKWRGQLESVVDHYPDLDWASQALTNLQG